MQSKDWKSRWHDIIFGAETPEGSTCDLLLLLILLSVIVVVMDSVEGFHSSNGQWLLRIEWIIMIPGFTIIAVPTGTISVEMSRQFVPSANTEVCPGCGRSGHADDADYRRHCGTKLQQ